MAADQEPEYRLKVVEDGDRFYIEVRYHELVARVRVHKKFGKTFRTVRNVLRHSMKCKVDSDDLARRLSRLIKSKHLPARMGLAASAQEKMLARELRRLGVPYRRQVRIAGYFVDFLVGERIVVEVEGLQHYLDPERELRRLKEIESCGYEVHRVSSHEVAKNPAAIAEYVREVYSRKAGQKSPGGGTAL